MTRKEEIKQLIVATVRKHLPGVPVHVFIFGSQANQPELQAADIDVGLDASEPLPANKVMAISSELNESPVTLFEFDIVDFATVSDRFKQVATMQTETVAQA